jgi:hypothetical protein
MKRSDIIKLAQSLLVQGQIDPLWTSAEWDLYFSEAIDLLHESFVESESDYFIRRGVELTVVNGRCSLPTDFYSVIWLFDKTGHIPALDLDDHKRFERTGFVLEDDEIVLQNFGTFPAKIYLDYYRLPKEIPIWDGSEDLNNDTFVPDPVFATVRGARVIARLIQIQAQSKDGTNTDAIYQHAQLVADRFVDRFLSRKESQ